MLSHYDVVIFNSTTGDVLNDDQQAAFERYIRAGHGYVGIHAAADSEYDWHWYGQLVGGVLPQPPGRHADRDGGRGGHRGPADAGLPARWTRTDEWYNYKEFDNASGRRLLARATPPVCTCC